MSAELSASEFEACLHQTFQISAGEERFDAELVEVRGLQGDTGREDKSPFSILFRAGKGQLIEQQIMDVAGEKLGEHQLFLVPVGPDPDHESRGMLYEAVFT